MNKISEVIKTVKDFAVKLTYGPYLVKHISTRLTDNHGFTILLERKKMSRL